MSEGIYQPVGKRGITLSAGQRQLLSFARALAGKPKVLILDEATSSVDPATEILIKDVIERITVGQTTLVIAHRLSTIKNADEIFVLDNGKIVEQGKHDELLAKSGVYARLYERTATL